MKVLIVGGAGFLGANLVRRVLQEEGTQVTVFETLEPHLHATVAHLRPVWDRIRFVRGDLRDEYLLADVVQDQDLIFNCAAQTSHPLSIQFPLLDTEINCAGSLKLLEAIRLLSPQAVVVYTSSSTVIGRASDRVVDEDHRERPLDIYSANKGVAEKYYSIYHGLHGLRTVVLRFANLFGPFGKGYPEFGFVNYFIHLAWAGEPIRIFGPGDQTRNVMYVGDAADVLWKAARHPELYGQILFATGDEHLRVGEIAEGIVRVFDRGSVRYDVEWPEERRKIEVASVTYSSDRLRSLIGWKPQWTFKEGLLKTRQTLEQKESPQ